MAKYCKFNWYIIILFQFITEIQLSFVAIAENYIELNAFDAKQLQIENNQQVTASSRRGSIQVKAVLSDRVDKGTAFMSFHFADSVTNILTNDALDPITKTPEYDVCSIRVDPLQLS